MEKQYKVFIVARVGAYSYDVYLDNNVMTFSEAENQITELRNLLAQAKSVHFRVKNPNTLIPFTFVVLGQESTRKLDYYLTLEEIV
jgi:hypothetical protein